jgi:hypothetical protein
MKKIFILLSILIVCSCTPLFFGGKVVGAYYKHFKGKLECAYVSGWQPKPVCMCWICEPGFSNNHTFLVSENEIFCQQQIDP